MNIRLAAPEDFDAIWPIFQEVVKAGDTYTYDQDISQTEAMHKWMELPARTYVVEEEGTILGTYYIKVNHDGGGNHVCNCGYMVAGAARGRGLATAMCEHSQQTAREMGFEAMQFNFVVVSNTGAVRLWQQLGFDIVATLPGVFKHPELGYVGAHVMLKWLKKGKSVQEISNHGIST